MNIMLLCHAKKTNKRKPSPHHPVINHITEGTSAATILIDAERFFQNSIIVLNQNIVKSH